MNAILQSALIKVPFRATSRQVSVDEVQALVAAFGQLMPDWYLELLKTFPIVGSDFVLLRLMGGRQVHLSLEWMSPEVMIREAREAIPGRIVIKYGYIPVASCLNGSGDPYYIRPSDGDDPPLVEIFHDAVSESTGMHDSSKWMVSTSLSEFFTVATLR